MTTNNFATTLLLAAAISSLIGLGIVILSEYVKWLDKAWVIYSWAAGALFLDAVATSVVIFTAVTA